MTIVPRVIVRAAKRAAVWEDLPFGKPCKTIQPQWYIPTGAVPDKAIGQDSPRAASASAMW